MTNRTLMILDDAVESYIEQIEDLGGRFNGSDGNIHDFAREYSSVGDTVGILLASMKLRGMLEAFRSQITKELAKRVVTNNFDCIEKGCDGDCLDEDCPQLSL